MAKNIFRPRIHIYPLSRLVHAPAPSWEKLIASIEQGKEKAFAYYLPMREAVVLYCAKGGKHYERIRADMIDRARQMGGIRAQKLVEDNDVAFQTFVSKFYPKIDKFNRDLLRDGQEGVPIEGIELFGSPHFEAVDKNGAVRYVFLHAANWAPRELKVYLQLLSFIVAARYDAKAGQIWCMNLRSGKTIKFRSSDRLRIRCTDAAKHYARLSKALGSE